MKKVFNWTVMGWLAFAFIISQEFDPIKSHLDDIRAQLLGSSGPTNSEFRFRNDKSSGFATEPLPTNEVTKKISKPSGRELSTLKSSSKNGLPESKIKKIEKIPLTEIRPSNDPNSPYKEQKVEESNNSKKYNNEKTHTAQNPPQQKNIDLIDLYYTIHQEK